MNDFLMLQRRGPDDLNEFLIRNGFDPKVQDHHYKSDDLYINIVLGDMYKCTVTAIADGRRYKNTFQTMSSALFEAHLYNVARTNRLAWQLA